MNNKIVENEGSYAEVEKYIKKYIKDLPANRDIITEDTRSFARDLTKAEYTMILYRLLDSFGGWTLDSGKELIELIDSVRADFNISLPKPQFLATAPKPPFTATVPRPSSNARQSASTEVAPRPPFNAEYLLYLLLGRDEREVVIGDLIEGYGKVLTRFTKRRANIWFYKQVLGSVAPLLRRALLRIGALIWLGRILRRLIS